jgi:hypothetical protein
VEHRAIPVTGSFAPSVLDSMSVGPADEGRTKLIICTLLF